MIDVQFTPEFKRNLRTLAKKYRHIRDKEVSLPDPFVSKDTTVDEGARPLRLSAGGETSD